MNEILKVDNLAVDYSNVPIVRNVSFNIEKGEILGIVGESGCGKSTLMKAILQLMANNASVPEGAIEFLGKDLLKTSGEEMRHLRGDRLGVIFQNPGITLNPLRKIRTQFLETLKTHRSVDRDKAYEEIKELFAKLNLKDGERVLESYPFELSGGMSQRVAIALAMIMQPDLLLADEPTSALDVTVAAQSVEEMMRLRDRFGTSILIITHSMGVIAHMVDKVGVMYAGRMVEYGPKRSVMVETRHPYTKALMEAIPEINGQTPHGVDGRPPAFGEKIEGCPFAPRCQYATDECLKTTPVLTDLGGGHKTSCIQVLKGAVTV